MIAPNIEEIINEYFAKFEKNTSAGGAGGAGAE